MAIFQPTNVIPSMNTNSGTVSVSDTMQVQWQVNGNTAMTAYQIDVLKNDPYSTFVQTTGKITDGCPFYGTDRFGKPQFFTYNNEQSWHIWSALSMTDGNNYKLKITQWYSSNETVVSTQPNEALSPMTRYWFAISGGGYVTFIPTTSYSVADTFYYNATLQKAWVVLGSNNRLIQLTMSYSATEPTAGTQMGTMTVNEEASKENFVQQTSASPFATRSQPTVNIQVCATDDYSNPTDFTSGELNSSIGYFHANYQQAQKDPVRWVRWQVVSVNNGVIGDTLADTGDIYTPTLNYEFNGFFVGQEYAIKCVVESENGLQAETGWVVFTINVVDPQNYTGVLTAKCVEKENATLLEWDGITVISGVYTPPEESEEQYSYSNGSVVLPANSSISWDNLGKDSGGNTIPMNFPAPWTAVWKGQYNSEISYVSNLEDPMSSGGEVGCFAFSPDGKILVVYSDFPQSKSFATVQYSVNGTQITFQANLSKDVLFTPKKIVFSPDGKTLIISGDGASGKTSIYSVDGTTITYVRDITEYSPVQGASAVAFSPDGKTLVLGNTYKSSIYSVDGTTITYVNKLPKITLGTGGVSAVVFSPDGKTLVAGCYVSGGRVYPTIYTVEGTTINVVSTLNFQPNNIISILEFSPDGKTLVLGGDNARATFIYSVDETTLTLAGTVSRTGREYCVSSAVAFSPDGNTFIMSYTDSSNNTTYVSVFSVDGTTITLVEDILQDTLLSAIAFSPDGKTLVLGGTDGASTYSYNVPNCGVLMEIGAEETTYKLSIEGFAIKILEGNNQIAGLTIPLKADSLSLLIGQDNVSAFYYSQSTLLSTEQRQVIYSQKSISSVAIYGGNDGSIIDNVALYNNQQSSADIISLYQDNPAFEPVWNANNYTLYMTASFNGNLEAGTGSGSGTGFRIYRQEYGSNILTPIATLPANITSLKDYGISSRKAYKYSLYAYDTFNAFMSSVEAENIIVTNFNNYSLLVCSYDGEKDEYHVRKQYLFALNLTDNGSSNNNTPTISANFTQYPTVMKSVQNYKSGTLSALIGAVYTKQAVVEQISNYKRTVTPSTLDYFDSVSLEKELYDLSLTPYTLFLRDMRGHLRMVQASGAITQTPNIKSVKQQITISFPWVEIGDASDATVIQTPSDYGWDYDNQVLDVQLDVDTSTGQLWGTYPYPYKGTRFYLAAGTPVGTTPAQITMSDTASVRTDGQVTATVKVNNEVNDK